MWRDGLGIITEAFTLLGELLGFLGASGIVLFLLTLILLGFVNAFSPLPKLGNYVLVVAAMAALVLFGFEGFGDLPGRASMLRNYLVVMTTPVLALLLINVVWRTLTRRRPETEQLREAVTELTEQVAALRRERKAERQEDGPRLDEMVLSREPLTLRRKGSSLAPRRLH